MTSIVGICNLALSRLGTRATIASIDEASVEARVCKSNFADCRDTLLREFDWNFARRIEVLAERDEDPPLGWSYVYSVPNRCLKFRGLWSGPFPIGAPARWALGSIADVNGNDAVAIFANEAAATGWYTLQIENAELFSASFVKALSWRLAEAIALPITNKDSMADWARKKAMVAAAEAMATEANEGITVVDQYVPDALSVRGFSG